MLNTLSKIAANHLNARKGTGLIRTDVDIWKTPNEPVFLPYQAHWLTRNDDVAIDEKGRQIGWSFTHACWAVMEAITNNKSTIYTCYNRDSAKQFIKDCAMWSQVLNTAYRDVTQNDIINNRKINVFQITFNNGQEIQAVAGNSNNLRGKPGYNIILDELAYREEKIQDLLAGASANLIRGGKIRGGSTHCGIDSEFHKTIKAIHNGQLDYGTSRVTFRDALKEGLYRRECIKNKWEYSPENEKIWVEKIYRKYGIRAAEELDAEPGDFSGEGKVFAADSFRKVDYQITWNTQLYRYYDLASSTDANAFYSASVLIAHDTMTETMVVMGYEAEQRNPVDAHQAIIDRIIGNPERGIEADPVDTIHLVEQEPGSTSGFYLNSIKDACPNNNVYSYRPRISKLQRAMPPANAVLAGELCVLNAEWADKFIGIISKFDGTKKILVNDLTDCVTGIYDFIRNGTLIK